MIIALVILAVLALLIGRWLYRTGVRDERLKRRLQLLSSYQLSDTPSAELFTRAQRRELWFRIWRAADTVFGTQRLRLLGLVLAILVLMITVTAPFVLSAVQFLVLMLMVLSIPIGLFYWLKQANLRQFENDFPAALDLMSRAVSTGSSVEQGFEYVAEQVPGQVGELFGYLVAQLRIGVPVQAALEQACQRLRSPRLRYFSVAVVLNVESGGQLSEVLVKLSRDIQTQRTRETKLQAMTAEPRSSARIVAAIPVLVALGYYFYSPSNFSILLSHPLGQLISIYVVCSVVLGLIVIEQMTRVNTDA